MHPRPTRLGIFATLAALVLGTLVGTPPAQAAACVPAQSSVGLDVVLVDPTTVHDMAALITSARCVGAEVHLADLLMPGDSAHDPARLAAALEALLPTGAR